MCSHLSRLAFWWVPDRQTKEHIQCFKLHWTESSTWLQFFFFPTETLRHRNGRIQSTDQMYVDVRNRRASELCWWGRVCAGEWGWRRWRRWYRCRIKCLHQQGSVHVFCQPQHQKDFDVETIHPDSLCCVWTLVFVLFPSFTPNVNFSPSSWIQAPGWMVVQEILITGVKTQQPSYLDATWCQDLETYWQNVLHCIQVLCHSAKTNTVSYVRPTHLMHFMWKKSVFFM